MNTEKEPVCKKLSRDATPEERQAAHRAKMVRKAQRRTRDYKALDIRSRAYVTANLSRRHPHCGRHPHKAY